MTSSERDERAMDCAACESDFGALLSGEATREEMKRANEHLAACPECARMFGDLAVFKKRMSAAYGGARKEKTGAIPRRKMLYLAVAASLAVGLAVYPQLVDNQVMTPVIIEPSAVEVTNLAAAETTAIPRGEEELVLTDEEAGAMVELISDAELSVYFESNG